MLYWSCIRPAPGLLLVAVRLYDGHAHGWEPVWNRGKFYAKHIVHVDSPKYMTTDMDVEFFVAQPDGAPKETVDLTARECAGSYSRLFTVLLERPSFEILRPRDAKP